jgi:hypothetical protein
MPLVLIATPGDPNANSFLTLAEARSYFEGRLEVPEWENADSQEALLVMATRVLVALFSPLRKLIRMDPPFNSYYLIRPTWTGTATTTTQRLPWPRTGMYDRNGNEIGVMIIPQDLKEATAELAAHLAKEDRTLDKDQMLQGLRSVSAGSVSVSFKDDLDPTTALVIPDIVWNLLVPSWLTDEMIEYSNQALFDVVP